MYWKSSMSSLLYFATQLFILYFPEWKGVVCDPNFINFHPKMHLEKHNTRALHHLILTAHGNSHSKIEYSLVSNIYSTPILFFSKCVWIGTRVTFLHLWVRPQDGWTWILPSYAEAPWWAILLQSCKPYSWMHNIILIFLAPMIC